MSAKKEHHCWIGILNDYDQLESNNLYTNTYKRVLRQMSEHSKSMARVSSGWNALEPKDYLDGRKGLATLFKYCPICGQKINWKKIRAELNNK